MVGFIAISSVRVSFAEPFARNCSFHDLKDDLTCCYERIVIGCLSVMFMMLQFEEFGNAFIDDMN